jgi:hypothetical protein
MADAAALYEGVTVNIDHDRKEPYRERGMQERFGFLKNIRVADDGRAVYGDLHYLKSHSYAPVFIEHVERFPDKLGLSHNADGRDARRGGKRVVESIVKVNSVDLVQQPASGTLFESHEPFGEAYPSDLDSFVAGIRGHSPSGNNRKQTLDDKMRLLEDKDPAPLPSNLLAKDVVSAFERLAPKSVEALDKAFETAVRDVTRVTNIDREILDAIKRINIIYDRLRAEVDRRPALDAAKRQAVIESVCREVDARRGRLSAYRESAPVECPTDFKELALALR